jgi:hypothetical protein
MNEHPTPFTEEQLQQADLEYLHKQQADPYGERDAWRLMQRENQQRQQTEGRAS